MNKSDLISVAKGAAIAALGAALTYLTQWASGADFGTAGPAVGAVLAVVVNLGRKYLLPNQDTPSIVVPTDGRVRLRMNGQTYLVTPDTITRDDE